jgi:hypothetical protein
MNNIAPALGYSSLHVPRPVVSGGASRGGGLSVVFRDSVVVRHHPMAEKFCPSTFEVQLIRVRLPPSTVRAVFNIYRPQRILKRSTSVAAFVDELSDVITSFDASCADNIVIIGDLNAPGVDGSHIDDELATMFESLGMTQFVSEVTICFDVIASADSTRGPLSKGFRSTMAVECQIIAKLASHRSKQNVCHQCRNLKAVDPISFRTSRSSVNFATPLCSAVLSQLSMASRNSSNVSSSQFSTSLHQFDVVFGVHLIRPQSGCQLKPSLQKRASSS